MKAIKGIICKFFGNEWSYAVAHITPQRVCLRCDKFQTKKKLRFFPEIDMEDS